MPARPLSSPKLKVGGHHRPVLKPCPEGAARTYRRLAAIGGRKRAYGRRLAFHLAALSKSPDPARRALRWGIPAVWYGIRPAGTALPTGPPRPRLPVRRRS